LTINGNLTIVFNPMEELNWLGTMPCKTDLIALILTLPLLLGSLNKVRTQCTKTSCCGV